MIATTAGSGFSTAAEQLGQALNRDRSDYCPTRLGDYEIIREIGRGGMGVVYEARQLTLDRIVALKVLSANFFPSATSVSRFRREARAASTLHHTNIVPIYEVGEADGIQFYPMQLIDGVNLAKLPESPIAPRSKREVPNRQMVSRIDVEESGKKRSDNQHSHGKRLGHTRYGRGSIGDFRLIADVGQQVAGALEYAHQRDVIHRDVKPANQIALGGVHPEKQVLVISASDVEPVARTTWYESDAPYLERYDAPNLLKISPDGELLFASFTRGFCVKGIRRKFVNRMLHHVDSVANKFFWDTQPRSIQWFPDSRRFVVGAQESDARICAIDELTRSTNLIRFKFLNVSGNCPSRSDLTIDAGTKKMEVLVT